MAKSTGGLIKAPHTNPQVKDPSPKQKPGTATVERPGGHGPLSGTPSKPKQPPTPGKG